MTSIYVFIRLRQTVIIVNLTITIIYLKYDKKVQVYYFKWVKITQIWNSTFSEPTAPLYQHHPNTGMILRICCTAIH